MDGGRGEVKASGNEGVQDKKCSLLCLESERWKKIIGNNDNNRKHNLCRNAGKLTQDCNDLGLVAMQEI